MGTIDAPNPWTLSVITRRLLRVRWLKGMCLLVCTCVMSSLLPANPSAADGGPVVQAPVAELFGSHPSFGMSGQGVNTATGNFTLTEVDLPFSVDLLTWGRTFNSLDATDGALGRGWSTSLSDRLLVADDGRVDFRSDEGRVVVFVPDGAGGYRRPRGLEADLVGLASGGFELRYLGGETSTFDAAGRLVERAVEGQTVTLDYGDDGRLVRARHSAGAELDLSYDGAGRLVEAAASDGRSVRYGYTDDGALTSVTRVDGGVVHYEIADGRISRIVDPDDRVRLENTYDDAGRVSRQDAAGGSQATFAYDEAVGATTVVSQPGDVRLVYQHDDAGRLVRLTDPAGREVVRTFDDNGRLSGGTARGGAVAKYTYDGRGNMTSASLGGITTSVAYDARDRVERLTDPAGGTTTYEYTGASRVPSVVSDALGGTTRNEVADGLIIATTDPSGATTRFGYDQQRRLVSTVDPLGNTTRYGHDAAGRVTETTMPSGRKTSYGYDAAGRSVSETDGLGNVTKHRYSSAGLLLETTDPTGAVTRLGYDGAGRMTTSTDPLGRTSTYGYDGNGKLTSMTDPGGGVGRFTRDAFGRVSSLIDPTGTETRFGYDADGRQTEQVEPVGTTRTTYDGNGNVATTTDALGATTSHEYDGAGREVATTDPLGAVWRSGYDQLGRLVSRTDPTGATTRYEYDAASRVVAVTDPLGHTTRYEYDAAGHVTKVIDPLGAELLFAYDADGRRVAETTPTGLVTRFAYDAENRVKTVTDPRGGVMAYEYTARGELAKSTTPGGAVRQLRYDAAGQMTESVDPNGATTKYTYDTAGRLVTITDAKGADHDFTYDVAGRQTSSTDPLGRTTRQDYDERGNLVTVTEPSGRKLRMEYDALNRVTRKIGADGATVSFGYDKAGRRTAMTDGRGTTSYAYDPLGRPLSVRQPNGSTVTARYDAAGRRTELGYPDGLTVAYRYDDDNRLVGLSDPRAGETAYTLDPDGRLRAEHLPNGTSRSYTYDHDVLVGYQQDGEGGAAPTAAQLADTDPAARTKLDVGFTRNADGRIVRQTGDGPDQVFTYDPAGQLLSATKQTGGTVKATYDAVGNRTSMSRAGVLTNYSYDAADQLVTIDTGPQHDDLTYDSVGRLTTRRGGNEALTVDYDGFGLPTVVTRSQGGVTRTSTASYTGDRLLSRLETVRDPGDPPPQESTVDYVWDPAPGIPQILRQDGEAAADFVYGYGRATADTATGSAVFARDAYASSLRTADTKDWVAAGRYDVFGNPEQAGTPSLVNPLFAYRSELALGSLVYLRARIYDAGTGRFTSRDPISTQVGQVDTVSPYAYASNDPLNAIDPTGKFTVPDDGYGAILQLGGGLNSCNQAPGFPERQRKFFQGVERGQFIGGTLCTRGYIPKPCLDAEQNCLQELWDTSQKERAAQAFTINELDKRREGGWTRFWDDRWGFGTDVARGVEWEVGPDMQKDGWRSDIVTDDRWTYEIKEFAPNAAALAERDLEKNLGNAGTDFAIRWIRGTELQNWANYFEIRDSWDDYWVPDRVYVWGYLNPPGHIYFAKDEKAAVPADVKAKAKEMERTEQGKDPNSIDKVLRDLSQFPFPFPVRVPIFSG